MLGVQCWIAENGAPKLTFAYGGDQSMGESKRCVEGILRSEFEFLRVRVA